jgi:glycosyltransferase involved in cell wall biosynthesis
MTQIINPYDGKDIEPSFKSDKFKILALPTDEGGCGWYRVRQNILEIKRQDLADVRIMESTADEKVMVDLVQGADIVLARHNSSKMLRAILSANPTKSVIFDEDDNVSKILPSNEGYLHLGTKDVVAPTSKGEVPLWVTGITPGFNKYANLWHLKEIEYCLQACDAITTTTPYIAEYFRRFNSDVFVVPNYIDFRLYPNVEVHDLDKKLELRIGWSGGVSHMSDIQGSVNAVKKYMDKHDNTVYYTVGSNYPALFKGYEDRVRFIEWVSFEAHPYRMKTLDLDIAVIPLEDQEFNDYKSEVKFSEFAALGVPMIVRNRLPYSLYAQDGVNCYTFSDEDELLNKLEILALDNRKRKKIIRNAYEWVRDTRDVAKGAKDIVELYKGISDGSKLVG